MRTPTILIALTCALGLALASAQADDLTSDMCMACHEVEPSTPVVVPATPGYDLFLLAESIHGAFECTDCHGSVSDEEHPGAKPPAVDCSMCHTDEAENLAASVHHAADPASATGFPRCSSCHGAHGVFPSDDPRSYTYGQELRDTCSQCHALEGRLYQESLHGQAIANGDPLAPHCWDCHGNHDVLPPRNPKSKTNPINIPEMCGACHAENAPVALVRNIEQHNILTNYEESIHGEGVKKKGLTVTAVCSSCHTSHHVLPHTDPRSSIARGNVVQTCMQCHALIEQVHRKVVEGKLWEAEPEKVPVCIDCHQPHEARKVYYDEGVSDRDCMLCHQKEVAGATRTFAPVDTEELAHSTHKNARCAQCHTGTDPSHTRPCATVVAKVDCSICHAEVVANYAEGTHGMLAAKRDPDAPECLDCHSAHATQSRTDPSSPTFPRNVPNLCGSCHREGKQAAERIAAGEQHEIVQHYTMSIHGKGLLESGLTVTAMCSNCHTPHRPLPSEDPNSSVNRQNVAHTCGQCHDGIEATFGASIHSPSVTHTDKTLPVCSDCHSAHSIARTGEEAFVASVIGACGQCHKEEAETYRDTIHGKVSQGPGQAAKCFDCHGSHDILPPENPRSRLSHDNIVETCAKCHEGAHRQFAGYLTHATHHDRKKYPALFFAFWAMTLLLVSTFAFFGLHTLAWLPTSFRELRKQKHAAVHMGDQRLFRRFEPLPRQLHFFLILSFFGLALTGMALKFSYMPWAQWLAGMLGGFESSGTIHRFCAVVMVIVFIIHIGWLLQRKRKRGRTWKQMLLGSGSLVPNLRDARELVQTLKWFIGRGPRPQYGEWTYWEKFDYFAVFWGVFIIGSTGFMLWFPELFTLVLPGWFINVATIIHSDEALLAVGFIFTVHFFNTHFRPEKFPMDFVMFTGRVPVEELKEERPRYYEDLVASGELEKNIVPPAPREMHFWGGVFGAIALIIGFSLVGLILWSMLFGYR